MYDDEEGEAYLRLDHARWEFKRAEKEYYRAKEELEQAEATYRDILGVEKGVINDVD